MRAGNLARIIAAATIVMAVAAPVASNAETNCENPYAKITQPDGGQLIVNGLVVQTGTGQQLTLSTTGTVDVVIEHECAQFLQLTVTKTGPGAPTAIHNNSWGPLDCGKGTITNVVKIGLDGGTYQFDVNGVSCAGRKLRSDGHGGTIIDPPLGVRSMG